MPNPPGGLSRINSTMVTGVVGLAPIQQTQFLIVTLNKIERSTSFNLYQ